MIVSPTTSALTAPDFSAILAQAASRPPGGPMDFLFPMLLMGVMVYFLMIRPQQKRTKAMKAMLDALGSGDSVVTAGGIHGLVAGIKDNTVTLKIADNVKIRIDKASIGRVEKSREKTSEESDAAAAEA
jgi:preprotein translocase subunit YajC